MLYRTVKQKLLQLSKTYKVVAITGPRQSGKTTLAKNVFDNKDFISFDDNNIRKIASQDSVNFVKSFTKGAIFDEAQKVPEIFEAIKLVVDEENSYGKFILTGSSQFRINNNIHESLAGRVGLLTLLPLSISELSHSSLLPDSVFELAINGLYPEIYNMAANITTNNIKVSTSNSNAQLEEQTTLNKTAINISDISRSYYTNYVDTYLTMDARELINIGNLESYSDFIKLCAHYSGQIVNYEKISRKLGVSAVTVKKWLSILQASNIVFLLRPYYKNFSKTLIKSPKLYFTDPGLLCFLLGISSVKDLITSNKKGAVVESFVISELLKQRYNQGLHHDLYYFRDKNNFEIDVLAEWSKKYAVEIKSNEKMHDKYLNNILKFCKNIDNSFTGSLFITDNLSGIFGDIIYAGWKDWGKSLISE